VAKSFQKILQKQGIKFKLNTKVTGVEKRDDGKVGVNVEGAKDCKSEQVGPDSRRHDWPMAWLTSSLVY
jgi:dihydrolipoamide dehydrogenase